MNCELTLSVKKTLYITGKTVYNYNIVKLGGKGSELLKNIIIDPKDPFAHYEAAHKVKQRNDVAFGANYAVNSVAAFAAFSMCELTVGSLNLGVLLGAAMIVSTCLASRRKRKWIVASLLLDFAAMVISGIFCPMDSTLFSLFLLMLGAGYNFVLLFCANQRDELKKIPGWPNFVDTRPMMGKNRQKSIKLQPVGRPAGGMAAARVQNYIPGQMGSVGISNVNLPNKTAAPKQATMDGVYSEPSLSTPIYREKPPAYKRTAVSLKLKGKHSDKMEDAVSYTSADAYNLEAAKELADVPEDVTENIELYLGHLLPDYTNYDAEPVFREENRNMKIIERK